MKLTVDFKNSIGEVSQFAATLLPDLIEYRKAEKLSCLHLQYAMGKISLTTILSSINVRIHFNYFMPLAL